MTDETPLSPKPPAPAGDASPPPKTARATPLVVPGMGMLGASLMGGALAAAVGMFLVLPALKRRAARPKRAKDKQP